jgi:uridylate kinase
LLIYIDDTALYRFGLDYVWATLKVLERGLKVASRSWIGPPVTSCKDNDLRMIPLNMNKPGNILRVVSGERVGSLVSA